MVLADDAEGVNVVEFDGEPCWEVVWSDKADDDYTERITVLFRQSDYQPVRIEVEINSLERELRTVRVSELELWEVLEPEAIDPVLFDRQALNAEGVFENREYGPEDIAELAEFDAWLLSQKYEGTAYAPPWRFSRPGRHELATSAGGELEALYFTEPQSNQPAVALLVVARISDNEIETWLDGPSGTASAWEGSATESEWRHVEDRRYYERVGIGANTYSRALVTLGDATIVVSTSDSAATARAIAALTRMNPPAEERRQPAFQVPPFVGLIEKPAEKPAEEPSDDRTPLADHSVQVDGGVEWTIENAEGWPNGLLGVAQGVVTQ
ncbi:MAG: hypothetical protein Q8M66_01250, partial [Actinomycetota bacterium]|nr:hypothetical protein [Actinomycetota bacterium]